MACECEDRYLVLNTINTSLHPKISNAKPNLYSQNSAIIDSGCSGNYLRPDAPVVTRDYTTPPVTAGTPNGSTITSSCSALLPNPHLPIIARKATIFPNLTYRSLLSVGQFCDAGYTVTFDTTTVTMSHPSAPTIIGIRDAPSKMYFVDLTNMTEPHPQRCPISTPNTIKNVHDMRTKVDLATWLHLCAFSPVVHTWTQAINMFFLPHGPASLAHSSTSIFQSLSRPQKGILNSPAKTSAAPSQRNPSSFHLPS